MAETRTFAVTGMMPPELAEARVAMRWPSLVVYPVLPQVSSGLQMLAYHLLMATIKLPTILAGLLLIVTLPLAIAIAMVGWLLLAPLFVLRLKPFFMTRYVLTNRRLMIQKGWSMQPVQQVKLEEICEVRVVPGSENSFYRSADLEILSDGKVMVKLPGVREYQQFKINIDSAYLAWGRKSPPKEQAFPAK